GDVNFNGAGRSFAIVTGVKSLALAMLISGNVSFEGAGGYNRLLSDVAEGNQIGRASCSEREFSDEWDGGVRGALG
ncbi:hypothetical protein, partial [Aeromonas hydrophila]|uniref:hypothetical protein n=1 Tax=Aeromonas hydrophila TaxID=644 RepID=UPI001C5B7193